MNRVALFVLTIPDHDRLVPITKDLSTVSGVSGWYAVDGHANLIVIVEGSSDPLLNYLHRLAGDVSMTMCEVLFPAQPISHPPSTNGDCSAWVFADVEPSFQEAVRQEVSSTSGVALTLATRGGADLVALITAKTLDDVDQIINRCIQPLDGILRLKRNRVINLTSL